jgi:hypothetical protein
MVRAEMPPPPCVPYTRYAYGWMEMAGLLRAGEPGPDGEHGAVHVADFAAHVARLHADSDIGFSREYNEILR